MTPWIVIAVLAVLSAIMMLLERQGLPTTLQLTFKSDVKRETRFLAQYGQTVCTIIAIILILQFDHAGGVRVVEALAAAVLATTIVATGLKRALGRARPRRPDAGKFLGPSLKHGNYRESFPSSHSACAVAFSGVLAMAYPNAAVTFWALAIICALLRYVMDAHWPSDVLGGIALGYAGAILSWRFFF